jgi:hypothetical protein
MSADAARERRTALKYSNVIDRERLRETSIGW